MARGLRELLARRLPDGGFAGRPGGQYRPDATAWAALALLASDGHEDVLRAARERLAADQLEDGRIPIAPQHPDTAWPTYLAVLAWQGAAEQLAAQRRAIAFLLATTGLHWRVAGESPFGHDTSLEGWPWVLNTHSWVEPTSLCMLALRATGRAGHARVETATRMLLDRMLPAGGWNYGNTSVYGNPLRPLPDSTGMALDALADRVAPARMRASLDYLVGLLPRTRTPLTTGWGVLGLGAWRERPARADDWLAETLARQQAVGPYDTAQLALLLVALRAPAGLTSALAPELDGA